MIGAMPEARSLPATGAPHGAPPAPRPALSAELTPLESLVHHRGLVPYDMPLEQVHRLFGERDVDFLALVRDEAVTGLCGRARLGFLLGSRYGFALYSKSPAHHAQVAAPLVFMLDTPVREVLDRALARKGDEFYEDVALVDSELRLQGLIPVETLAQLQTRLVAEQLVELRRQNLELFQSNSALRQAQGLYQGLFASDALGVALLDPRGVIQAHNRRLAELLNLSDGAIEGTVLADLVNERERRLFQSVLAAHEQRGHASLTREYFLEIPDRGARLFRFSTGWIGETGQICACLDDITEQRASERHEQRQEKQLLLDTLVGGIAHELNNKLTPVLGFADLLTVGDSDQVPRYAGYISKSADEAATIIRQLLQLSKPEAGNRQNVDLRNVVDESLLMLKFKLRESRAQLRTALPEERVAVWADGAQLKQVVINLILNALQAVDAVAEPILDIEVSHGGGQGLVRVTDNGAGIPAGILDRIFDPFFTTKGPDRGSGLGLSICSSLVRQHGGTIAVESEPGRGSQFTVSFPFVVGDVESGRPAAAAGQTRRADFGPEAARRRVLVVEDEEVVGKLMQEVLGSSFGCGVDLAGNGTDALRCVVQNDYVLVVSDIRMPEMNGMEFYLHLCELRPELSQRVVFVTGHAGDPAMEEELARWSVPVVAKPFPPRRLVEVCAPLLRAVGATAATA
jgi:two-component system cell cycle sensor histidine kinase/response regulator CckA